MIQFKQWLFYVEMHEMSSRWAASTQRLCHSYQRPHGNQTCWSFPFLEIGERERGESEWRVRIIDTKIGANSLPLSHPAQQQLPFGIGPFPPRLPPNFGPFFLAGENRPPRLILVFVPEEKFPSYSIAAFLGPRYQRPHHTQNSRNSSKIRHCLRENYFAICYELFLFRVSRRFCPLSRMPILVSYSPLNGRPLCQKRLELTRLESVK